MKNLRILDITKKFPGVIALDSVSLEIIDGELFTLLGPSGCGKTTLLRTIAGFHKADNGHIYLGKESLDDVPVFKRKIGMVFQNYAVFPHMSIFDNIAYGLRSQKVQKQDIQRRVYDVVHLVKLEGLEHRNPTELSGGQQQRVALARALVINPRLLLMDEPLSNLDAKLRVEMRSEIRKVQRELNITTVYVTHDQEEALAISDRIAILKSGKLIQCGTPWNLYQEPTNVFVVDFLGSANFLQGSLSDNGTVKVNNCDITTIPNDFSTGNGDTIDIAVRPEDISIHISQDNREGLWMEGSVQEAVFLGPILRFRIDTSEGELEVMAFKTVLERKFSKGDKVQLYTSLKNLKIFPGKKSA